MAVVTQATANDQAANPPSKLSIGPFPSGTPVHLLPHVELKSLPDWAQEQMPPLGTARCLRDPDHTEDRGLTWREVKEKGLLRVP